MLVCARLCVVYNCVGMVRMHTYCAVSKDHIHGENGLLISKDIAGDVIKFFSLNKFIIKQKKLTNLYNTMLIIQNQFT